MTYFPFIVGLIISLSFLHPLAGVTDRPQGRRVDIVKAYEEPTTVKQTYIGMQEKVKTIFHIIHLQAPRLAAHLLVKPTTPRTVKRQMYRNNPEVSFPENYFRIILATPMLQKFNSEINSRLSKFITNASKIL